MTKASELAASLAAVMDAGDTPSRALLWEIADCLAMLAHKRGGIHLGSRDSAEQMLDSVRKQCDELGISVEVF
jgi:hypothetical protein